MQRNFSDSVTFLQRLRYLDREEPIMSRLSPSDYMRQYHQIPVNAVGPTGAPMGGVAHVTRYQHVAAVERDRLIAAVKKVLGLKHLPKLNENWITLPGSERTRSTGASSNTAKGRRNRVLTRPPTITSNRS